MVYKFISYLKFLIKSTNQHGVHSPFVYNFVTKGLYTKNTKSPLTKKYSELKTLSSKEIKVLSKTITYFNVDEIFFQNNLSNLQLNQLDKRELVFLNDLKQLQLINLSTHFFIVAQNIYKDKKSYTTWLNYLEKTENIVTIDTFTYGIIFFRPQQAKEHFIIRV
ncbi:hypothetical protein [Polaribacter sp.]|uniref:hypothetical protein n=1 Tax=Polaribacter sp. TaxID=1920175 RepID=UPI0025F3D943|nr:hypothetical protein [Polaribacter sp.]